jgi:hypothetical protein
MLPILVLRSLIPVGFMPMVGAGYSVQIVICNSYAPVPGASPSRSMAMDMSMPLDGGMDMSQNHHGNAPIGGGPPVHQDHNSCPYGFSPALGALPTLALLPVAVQRPPELAIAAAQVVYFEVPSRAQSPRGPPV